LATLSIDAPRSTLQLPQVTFDDPRCTPDDTFATWFLKNGWPGLNTTLMAEHWEITEAVLRIAQPDATMVCRACGHGFTKANPLLWANRTVAQAHQPVPPLPKQAFKKLIEAQADTIKSGDTDVTLIGYHTQAPLIYCLACTLILNTSVMDQATQIPKQLAFWWTPQRSAWPWMTPGALWELPRERPLVFRAQSGSGKNHAKWGTAIAINWDPQWVLFPLIDRDAVRGVYWHPVSSAHLTALPEAYRAWVAEQRQAAAASRRRFALKDDEISAWLRQTLHIPYASQRIAAIEWDQKQIIKALKDYEKAHRLP